MTDRLEKIFSSLSDCNVFADIGCDHGYIAEAMVKSGKCKKAIIADISKSCLSKAENLLMPYIERGIVESVVSDGFENISHCDLALIAGMGGEEIVSILENEKNLPSKLVLQPMKNCDKVRTVVLECGYKFISDFVFKSSGKFYNLIVLEKGSDSLTKEEIEFGRDNLIKFNPDFKEMIGEQIKKLEKVLSNPNMTISAKLQVEKKIERLKKYEN